MTLRIGIIGLDGSLITVWYEKMPGDTLASVQMARWGWE